MRPLGGEGEREREREREREGERERERQREKVCGWIKGEVGLMFSCQ